jgi:outer membrane receptor for ferrienterochelin and colicins
VLIDGVRQNPMGNITPNSFNDSQSVFIPPVAAIERIEVIRGPQSTLYGSDALGGVVNVITRKAGPAWSGSASLGHTFQGDGEFGDKTTLEAYVAGPLAGDALLLQLFGKVYSRDASEMQIPGVSCRATSPPTHRRWARTRWRPTPTRWAASCASPPTRATSPAST